jgi:hypothetical protein
MVPLRAGKPSLLTFSFTEVVPRFQIVSLADNTVYEVGVRALEFADLKPPGLVFSPAPSIQPAFWSAPAEFAQSNDHSKNATVSRRLKLARCLAIVILRSAPILPVPRILSDYTSDLHGGNGEWKRLGFPVEPFRQDLFTRQAKQ